MISSSQQVSGKRVQALGPASVPTLRLMLVRGRKVSVQKLKGYEEESGVSGGGGWGSGPGGRRGANSQLLLAAR